MNTKILNEIKSAMQNKDNIRKDIFKSVRDKALAMAKDAKIEIPTDDMYNAAFLKEYNQHNQALKELSKSNTDGYKNSDFYKTTLAKIDILKEYIPKQMDREEVIEAIKEIINTAPSDTPKGKLTGMVMKSLNGKADKDLLVTCCKEIL